MVSQLKGRYERVWFTACPPLLSNDAKRKGTTIVVREIIFSLPIYIWREWGEGGGVGVSAVMMWRLHDAIYVAALQNVCRAPVT